MSEGAARGITAHVMSGSAHKNGVMFVTIGIALAEHFTHVYPQSLSKEASGDEAENAVDRFIVVCRRRPDVRATFAFGSFAT